MNLNLRQTKHKSSLGGVSHLTRRAYYENGVVQCECETTGECVLVG